LTETSLCGAWLHSVMSHIPCAVNIAVSGMCVLCACANYNANIHIERNGHPTTGHKGPEVEQKYSSILPLTSALDGNGWSTQRPDPRVRNPVSILQEVVWASELSGLLWQNEPLPRFDPRTIQPVTGRYFVWAIPTHYLDVTHINIRHTNSLVLFLLSFV